MNCAMRRIEKALGKIRQFPGAFCWVLKDGSRVPATGANDPLSFLIYPFRGYCGFPNTYPDSWECTGAGEPDEITKSIFEEVISMVPFIKRVEEIKQKLNSAVSFVTITYTDGRKKNFSVDIAIDEFLNNADSISNAECARPDSGRLAALLMGLKEDLPEGWRAKEVPDIIPKEAPAETYEDRRAFIEKRVEGLTTSAPNPPSDSPHCI